MSCDQKVERIKLLISDHLQFSSVDEAQEFANSYKQPLSSKTCQRIRKMAERFARGPLGIQRLFGSRQDPRSVISLVEEAMRSLAREYVEKSAPPSSHEQTAPA